MEFRRITPDIHSTKLDESKQFYGEFIGLKLAMDMGWILTFISESNSSAQINILQASKSINNENTAISIEASDVDFLYEKARSEKLEIIYPLTVEKWGVKRFFLRDPNGVTVNLLCHI